MAYVGTFRSQTIDGAASSFEEYIHATKDFLDVNCLADFVRQWFLHGGVEDCSDSREIFLMVFPLIIDKWLRDPSILDYPGDDETPAFERRVTTVFNADAQGHRFYDVLDPYEFESIKTTPNRYYDHYHRQDLSSLA